MLYETLFDLLQIEHALALVEQAAPNRKRGLDLDRIRAAIVEVRAVVTSESEGVTLR